MLDGSLLYEAIFVFKETEPWNDNFDQFGIPDKNFMMNSGSTFPFTVGIIMY
jgi:hypothetical protein